MRLTEMGRVETVDDLSQFGQLQSSRRSAQFRRKRSKQAGQREIDPHAPPAPDFIFDQRIAW